MGRRSTNNRRSGTVMSGVNSWRWFRTFLLTAQLRWEWINKRLINFRVRQLLQNIIRLSLNVRHFRIFYFLVKLLKDWNIFFPNTWMFSMISDTFVLLWVSSSCVDDWSSSECVISSSLTLVSASDGLLSPTDWISFSSSWLFYYRINFLSANWNKPVLIWFLHHSSLLCFLHWIWRVKRIFQNKIKFVNSLLYTYPRKVGCWRW